MDVASPLEVNHVKPVCCATVHVIVFYLFAIFHLLHECCLSVDEFMYVIALVYSTWKVKHKLNVSSSLYMSLSVLDS